MFLYSILVHWEISKIPLLKWQRFWPGGIAQYWWSILAFLQTWSLKMLIGGEGWVWSTRRYCNVESQPKINYLDIGPVTPFCWWQLCPHFWHISITQGLHAGFSLHSQLANPVFPSQQHIWGSTSYQNRQTDTALGGWQHMQPKLGRHVEPVHQNK